VRRASTILVVALLAVSCGKDGPPMPPLRVVPDAVTNLDVRRQGNEVRITFALPVKNLYAQGPVNLEGVEVFAATVAAGAMPPTNKELLALAYRVATFEARPPPPAETAKSKAQPPGEAPKPPPAPQKELPGPGDTVSYVEALTEDRRKPDFTKMPPPAKTPVTPPPTPPPTQMRPAVAPKPPEPPVAKRVYIIRALARGGRPGAVTQRIEVPLADQFPAPTGVTATHTPTSITLAWTALPPETPVSYNVYGAEGGPPINPNPLNETSFEREGVEFGKQQCFVVRSVVKVGFLSLESEPSERACVTPVDTFAPEAPKGLSAVSGTSVISLIWDANTETDLAGYIVLRGEAPGDTLQPLTPAPIRETNFRDTTVKPGVRYIYAVVAVDNATPPNTSPHSARVEETAR
jgi:hypothetical protein